MAAFRSEYCGLVKVDDRFLVHTDKAAMEVNIRGTVIGAQEEGGLPFWTTVLRNADLQSGAPFYVITRRKFPVKQDFIISAYQPGLGHIDELTLPDSLGDINLPRPVLLQTDGSTFIAFGKQFYRQLSYSPVVGFTEDWVRPLGFAASTAFPVNTSLFVAGTAGRVQLLDNTGSMVWSYDYPLEIRAAKATSDGYILCGRNLTGQAAVYKLKTDGSLDWSKAYQGTVFLDIAPVGSNGYAATGRDLNSQMSLTRLDAAGNVQWEQTYGDAGGTGGVAALQVLPDEGFLLLGKGLDDLHLIRTDAVGNAPDPEKVQPNGRRLTTSSLQVDFLASPTLFFDGDAPTMITRDSNMAATIFACSPWVAALDPGENLRVAANDYFPAYMNSDYRQGSQATLGPDFDRVWAVSREDIRQLRLDFMQDGILDQPVPYDILTWPGRGNTAYQLRFDMTSVQTDASKFPAPFVDVNNDGVYNVYDGDYPKMKGDHMAWWILTDSTYHLKTYSEPLVVDLPVMAYAYDCTNNTILDNTIFVEYQLINQSGQDYNEAYFGFFTDADLGCFYDDYVGSIPQQDAWFVYNEDAEDLDCQGVQGFGTNIPIETMTYLNVPMDYMLYNLSGAFGTPPLGMLGPQLPHEYYNYLQGKWRDGTRLTKGGSGYNPFSIDYTNHVFSDNPADPQGWSMCTETFGFFDRRIVSSHGPFNLPAGDTLDFQLAFTLHPDIPHPCPDISQAVVPALEILQKWADEDLLELKTQLEPVYQLVAGATLTLDAGVSGGSYQWSNGSIEPTALINSPGTYTVTITGETGCSLVEEVLVQQLSKTGQPTDRPVWELRPNPASEQVLIDCAACTGKYRASLFNAQGQLVRRSGPVNSMLRWDVAELPTGLYWVELRDTNDVPTGKRLMIQR